MAEIIFGIDHGNGNMKGSNVDFPCGLVRYTSEPGRFMNEDILEYQGTFYTLSETRIGWTTEFFNNCISCWYFTRKILWI